ncbi:MAG: CCA tRNA nucleotidyltransferase [Armatimonadetes bacterium]|nr:CCA tRNA nucleotidyltransferase [Armatimonadota bacterium]
MLKKNAYLFLIIDLLKHFGFSGYLVGGSIRDLILKRKFHDFDLVIDGNLEKFAREFARRVKGRMVILNEKFKLIRVIVKEYNFDFSPLSVRIEKDLKKRDFTINALALNLLNNKIIDPFSGKEALNKKIISLISEKNLTEDPLRILRAFRFKAALNFKLEEKTLKALKKHAPGLKTISPERIRDELFKILYFKKSFSILKLMQNLNILNRLFNFKISLLKLKNLENLYEVSLKTKERVKIKEYFNQILSDNRKRFTLLKLASLFSPENSFLLKNYKLSNKELNYLNLAIKYNDIMTLENLMENFLEIKNHSLDVLFLSQAGISSGDYKNFLKILASYFKVNWSFKPLLNGDDLKQLGFTPGPDFKRILRRLSFLQLKGKIKTKPEAINFTKKIK